MWLPVAMLVLCAALAVGQSVESCCSISLIVRDPAGASVPGADIQIQSGAIRYQAVTGQSGAASVALRSPGLYTVTASAPGFHPASREVSIERDEKLQLDFTLTAVEPRRDSITVEGNLAPLEVNGSPSSATRDQIRALPERVADVRNALPLIPGVVRTPEGKLRISAAPEYQSTFLVNSIDVTDPATGSFGATVPIDIIETLDVYKSPFLAEYGQFSAAVVAVTTRRGGDRWHYELNDPTPELRIRSGHIHGVRGFTPRFALTGPVIPNKLYFAGAVAFALRKRPVYPLPFPYNEEKTQSLNTYAQFDYIPDASHLVSLSLHGVPQRASFVGLNFYTPQPAAPSWKAHEYRAALSDRFEKNGRIIESSISVSEVRGTTGAQGDALLTLTPVTTTGNYFLRQDRLAQRAQWIEIASLPRQRMLGSHEFKFGGSLTRSKLHGRAGASEVRIADLAGTLLDVIPSGPGHPWNLSDWAIGAFVQDGWEPVPTLRLDLGLRTDWQRISGLTRVAPRAGIAWMPSETAGTVLRGGYGWFYDRVPLIAYAFPSFPRRGVPNLLGPGADVSPGSFAPHSRTSTFEVDHPVTRWLTLHAGHIRTHSNDLLVVRPGPASLSLSGDGSARTQQLEFSGKIAWYPEQQWVISYVHTSGQGTLNGFSQFVGDFPVPVIRTALEAPLPELIPHRFLTWGVFPLRYGLQLAPVLEWRNGFPMSALDDAQQYAGVPNTLRLPNFFSLDVRVSKDIPIRRHKVRLSFSMFNVTDHGNYDAIRLNTADPQFGEPLGRRPRRFRIDFDWLF